MTLVWQEVSFVRRCFHGAFGLPQLWGGIAYSGVTVLMMSVDLVDFKQTERIWSLSRGKLNGPPPRALANWPDPVSRSICCESRVDVVAGTVGVAADGRSPGGEPGGRAERRAWVRARRLHGGHPVVGSGVQAAAKAAGVLRPSAECGRCWL